jgi:predicted RNase H-like nuclease (RuvC/YqgF family)
LIYLVNKLKESQAELAKFSEGGSRILKLEEEKKADVKRITDLESALLAQVELHKSEVLKLEEKLDEVSKNFEVEKEKREIAKTERGRVQRNVDELQTSKEQCFSIAAHCYGRLKNMFASNGLF